VPPYIAPFDGERTLPEGERLKLICRAAGSPRPSLHWFHDSRPLSLDPSRPARYAISPGPHNWHTDGCLGLPFPVLKCKYIFFTWNIRRQFYETALGNCYGLKLPKYWLQFKKIHLLCHLLQLSAHCRSLLRLRLRRPNLTVTAWCISGLEKVGYVGFSVFRFFSKNLKTWKSQKCSFFRFLNFRIFCQKTISLSCFFFYLVWLNQKFYQGKCS